MYGIDNIKNAKFNYVHIWPWTSVYYDLLCVVTYSNCILTFAIIIQLFAINTIMIPFLAGIAPSRFYIWHTLVSIYMSIAHFLILLCFYCRSPVYWYLIDIGATVRINCNTSYLTFVTSLIYYYWFIYG